MLDVSEPHVGVRVLSSYDDELTGGVHNVYVYDGHVYALSAGQRYDIISIEDPTTPHRVGSVRARQPRPLDPRRRRPGRHRLLGELERRRRGRRRRWRRPGRLAHEPGEDGKTIPFPTGWNHAVYPYRSAVDRQVLHLRGRRSGADRTSYSPIAEKGTGTPWLRGRVDALARVDPHPRRGTKDEEPELVARYEVPEAGSHNIWIEDDIMYVAFYNGGLRVVDVSGELLGNLYRQGREIGRFPAVRSRRLRPELAAGLGCAAAQRARSSFSDYNSGPVGGEARRDEKDGDRRIELWTLFGEAALGFRFSILLGRRRLAHRSSIRSTRRTTTPQVGSRGGSERVPAFEVVDQDGKTVDVRFDLKGPNGAVIVFHRSADW